MITPLAEHCWTRRIVEPEMIGPTASSSMLSFILASSPAWKLLMLLAGNRAKVSVMFGSEAMSKNSDDALANEADAEAG